ncbi:hypothetical protein C2G38_2237013 [Gigaspora rosea]|uniref:Uncharacterized protein n=1 Tax=Gigaspora rosea TaxID=44941 RepID=A0A397TNU8_9GLOM|nr:hypothetical protein C2G38_2237013 [Gigaspora rosea]
MTIKHFEKLSNNYIELLEKGIDFNVIIKNKLKDSLKDVNSIMKIDLESHISIQQFEIIIR